MTEERPGERIEDKSLGDLVALASTSVSHLIRSEITLAKTELSVDAKKAALGSALFGVALVFFTPVVVLLAFALAYGLMALGLWDWVAFLAVAGIWTLVGALLTLFGVMRVKGIKGPRRTMRTLKALPKALRPDHDDKRDRALTDAGKPALTD
jgi:Putative Actinobacterial Holin-X, holin superfamily III